MDGEFVLSEQRPSMQSRVKVVPLDQGQGVIFPVRHRPVKRQTLKLLRQFGLGQLAVTVIIELAQVLLRRSSSVAIGSSFGSLPT